MEWSVWLEKSMEKLTLIALFFWHSFISASVGFYSFPGTVTIFIQSSIAYLQDNKPVAAGLDLAFSILWGRYFSFALMRSPIEQLIWAKA